MKTAVRAIIIQDDKLLVMKRDKYGDLYYTLVGGGVDKGETPEAALKREVKEETGLDLKVEALVYTEKLEEPYASQFIYLCDIIPNESIALQVNSEEEKLNRFGANIHKPEWVTKSAFKTIPFRTPQLQNAIVKALEKGFPVEVENI